MGGPEEDHEDSVVSSIRKRAPPFMAVAESPLFDTVVVLDRLPGPSEGEGEAGEGEADNDQGGDSIDIFKDFGWGLGRALGTNSEVTSVQYFSTEL